jgi:hypothetical protein
MRRPSFAALVLVLVLSLALAACGSEEGDGESAAADTVDASADGLPETEEDAVELSPELVPEVQEDAIVPDIDDVAEELVDGVNEVEEEVTTYLACEGSTLVLPLESEADGTFLRGPTVQSLLEDRAIILWRTVSPEGEGCLSYRVGDAEAEPTEICAEADAQNQYEIPVTGLPAGEEIYYTVRVGERETTQLSFTSAPLSSEPVRLVVFGDGHTVHPSLSTIAAQALAANVDGLITVGDLVSQAEEPQFDTVFDALRALHHRVPHWAVLGNHEARGKPHFDAFALPGAAPVEPKEAWYGGRFGNVWFAALELQDIAMSAGFGTDLPEVAWLREALESEAATSASWRLLFIHEPPWCVGWGHCDPPIYRGEHAVKTLLMEIAAEYGVDATFHGHMHGLEWGVHEGVHVIVSGGGGGGLDHFCDNETPEDLPQPWFSDYQHHSLILDAGCDLLAVEAINLDGELIERIEIAKAVE